MVCKPFWQSVRNYLKAKQAANDSLLRDCVFYENECPWKEHCILPKVKIRQFLLWKNKVSSGFCFFFFALLYNFLPFFSRVKQTFCLFSTCEMTPCTKKGIFVCTRFLGSFGFLPYLPTKNWQKAQKFVRRFGRGSVYLSIDYVMRKYGVIILF